MERLVVPVEEQGQKLKSHRGHGMRSCLRLLEPPAICDDVCQSLERSTKILVVQLYDCSVRPPEWRGDKRDLRQMVLSR